MTEALSLARATLLAPAALDEPQLTQALGALMRPGIDAADLYFQYAVAESWVFEDGIVKSGSHHAERGVGVRAIAGDRQGLAYTEDIALPALHEAALQATAVAGAGAAATSVPVPRRAAPALYPPQDPLVSLPTTAKLELLARAAAAARAADARVAHVSATLSGSYEIVLIAAADGRRAADVRPLVRLGLSVMLEAGGRREQGYAGAGGRGGYDTLFAGDLPERLAREAVRQAQVAMEAVAAPAGEMPVVLGPGWPGVLLHEAVGHGLEGDFNRKGSSAYSGRIGEQVASPLCTVVDDGTLPGRRGSLNLDDEGTPSQRTVLIENGVLRGYLQDRLNARLMGMAPTGNGRRESFAELVLPRMTNTYLLAGPHDPAEIIASVERGLYAVNFGGGQVDITSGNFVFSTTEAYLIEHGRVTRPVKDATLIGNGPQILSRVSMVGNDLQLDPGIGVCGKDGQSVPVGVGQPTLKIDALTVGGTQT
ncbi:MAG: metalloprotease TldD [Gammaproteobacteria bacterium]|nr:metalloprotease TldD [Gammaproteobacteria bacterium]